MKKRLKTFSLNFQMTADFLNSAKYRNMDSCRRLKPKKTAFGNEKVNCHHKNLLTIYFKKINGKCLKLI